MVYESKLIAVIKHNNNILRETSKDTVRLPFGSEYSICFKNKDSRRCAISIDIDGTDVLSGNKFIVDANKEAELEGFMNPSGVITNKFKFIKKTKEISDYRGDRIDDGYIGIQFQFEQVMLTGTYYTPWILYPDISMKKIDISFFNPYCNYTTQIDNNISTTISSASDNSNSIVQDINNDIGITVPGTPTNIQTNRICLNLEPTIYSIVIRLVGESVEKPIYNNTKLTCKTCGKAARSSALYCPRCGTSLY